MSSRRTAIVYDWADTRHGGAEKVLLALHDLYPQAPLFTSFREQSAAWADNFSSIQTSYIQKLPHFWRQHKKYLAPLLPLAMEKFDFSGYQTIISVSSFPAKGIITHPEQLHVCYLLTPTRFLYSHAGDYVAHPDTVTRGVSTYLRQWDSQAARRPDKIIAISRLVAERMKEYYGRSADEIIYPTIIDTPVKNADIDHKLSSQLPPQFFLCVARLTAYKKIPLVVDICGQHGWPLVIIGAGPQLAEIQAQIRAQRWSHIHLFQDVAQEFITTCYQRALALVAPGLEDFGINLLEANAAGTLVITHPQSGARELLADDQALDLDPAALEESLKTHLAALTAAPKRTVASIKQDVNSFKRQWRQKVSQYENE